MLEVKGVSKRFGDFVALDNVSFNLKDGEIISLLGTNGAGKTTLIKIITGFSKESSGSIIYDNKVWKGKSERIKYVGWAPQEDSFYGNLTLMENLVFFGNLNNIERKEARKRAVELLKLLKLHNKNKTFAKDLSGGMKRRLNMAIAMMHSPKVLILDEPEAGVDPVSRVTLWDVVKEVGKNGTSIILVTHNLIETETLADRLVLMDAGKIIFEGSPLKLKKKYRQKTVENAFKKAVEKN